MHWLCLISFHSCSPKGLSQALLALTSSLLLPSFPSSYFTFSRWNVPSWNLGHTIFPASPDCLSPDKSYILQPWQASCHSPQTEPAFYHPLMCWPIFPGWDTPPLRLSDFSSSLNISHLLWDTFMDSDSFYIPSKISCNSMSQFASFLAYLFCSLYRDAS